MNLRGHEMHPDDSHMQHFACFACRKSFKQPGSGHVLSQHLRPFPCPSCKEEMVPLGKDFKAPPARDRAQWLKVELLYLFGITFEPPAESTGGPGPRPAKLNEVVAFLVSRGWDRSLVEQRLAALRQRRASP